MTREVAATPEHSRLRPEVVSKTSGRKTLQDSLILIDKPRGCTSFDVLRRLRRISGIRKTGHAGTLDPMATGLLICMTGRATKQMSKLVDLNKTYHGTMRLGEATPSYDADTEVVRQKDASHLSLDDLKSQSKQFTGTFVQKSPPYSAIKYQGERLYKKARRGEQGFRPPRVVTVESFLFERLNGCDASFIVTCSKGTYVRALAHDLGELLGVGAHLVALRRLSIGPFHVADAFTLDELLALYEGTTPDGPTAENG
ncbi:MAG: tRNA pseudouridine(55) synthase TruB [Rhodothermia bacterium]|nr:tRNA pseudouridine(55) synthase TruB [Rhodothermia bacterium]